MDSPVQSATVSGNDNIVVQAIESIVSVTVQSRRPQLRLTQYEKRSELAATSASETALLSAYRADVVPLIGRDREISAFQRWLDIPEAISVRIMVGAGGRGKTRLALELARAVTKNGWLAGFVTADELDRFRSQDHVEQWRWAKPVLIIVDYAASRAHQIRDWLGELVDASLEDRPKLRLLLLERLLLERQANRENGWLQTIFGFGDNDNSLATIALLDPPEPVELPPIDELEFRRVVFASLLKKANAALDAPALGTDAEFDRLLADRTWAGDPLYLMMAGLVAAKTGCRAALTVSRADLALSIARNELDRIGRIGAAQGIDERHRLPGAFVRHMAVMTTLVQGLSLIEARTLAATEREALGSAASLDAAIAALADALPSDANGAIAPILPDIVGEGAILAWLGPKGGIAMGGLDPHARIAAAARIALAKASSTLVRTAQDFTAADYAQPVEWLEALAGAPETDLGGLMEIASAVPEQSLALRKLASELTQRIVNSLRGPAVAETNAGSDFRLQWRYSMWLGALSVRLSDIGRRADALAAAREAVQINRRLAADQPNASRASLARSLDIFAGALRVLGHLEDAFAAARESVDIYRLLAVERSDDFLPILAMSLKNLALPLSDLGRREDALAATREAVEVHRRLAADRPDAFLPDLAASLNNLSAMLYQLGRRNDALAAAKEAVEIRRRLAADRPDAFLPDLAASLGNLAGALFLVFRLEEALAAVREAVDIYRRLAADRPDAFLPFLAASLGNLGNALGRVGRLEDSAVALREAVEIGRRLAVEQPDAVPPDLAGSSLILGTVLNLLGRREEALAATVEALTLLKPFFLRFPIPHKERMLIACKQYFDLTDSIGVERDEALIGPIFHSFEKLERSSDTVPSNNA